MPPSPPHLAFICAGDLDSEDDRDGETPIVKRYKPGSGPQTVNTPADALVLCALGADTCDSFVDRVSRAAIAAGESLPAEVGALESKVAAAVAAHAWDSRKHASVVDKILEGQCDGFDDTVDSLLVFVRHLDAVAADASNASWSALQDTLCEVGALLINTDYLPMDSVFTSRGCGVQKVVRAISRMSSYHTGVMDRSQCPISRPEWLERGNTSLIAITCCDALGDAVTGLKPAVVKCLLSPWMGDGEAVTGWLVDEVAVVDNTVLVSVSVSAQATNRVTLRVNIAGTDFSIPLKVGLVFTLVF